MSRILVTGGAGYIGSHTVVELLDAGYDVTVIDNFCNSSVESIKRVEQITGKSVQLHEFDIRDAERLEAVLAGMPFEAVIHFAGLKAVGESTHEPLRYYENNADGTLVLMKALQGTSVRKLIFSSTACVYGDQPIPYTESTAREPQNPYGNTKLVSELMMHDQAAADASIAMIALRYFNPIGAHPSGLIGEDPNGIPNNLMPFVAQVATGKREKLSIFGNDYETADGTGIRDYIHVTDLAKGHLAALEHGPETGFHAYNLGSGHGESVLGVVHAFEKASGQKIPYEFAPRRAGDLAEYYADPARAAAELHWKTELNLDDACRDTWNWQSHNPNGYTKEQS
ncbi:MAG TPA: UDP-glucose 4-epimerase GalE [Candidatus Saccharimonadales bacterium]|nr:UDP-glucose 4-epimerase GalE [Candidatus Saccharimonadales bacterium]